MHLYVGLYVRAEFRKFVKLTKFEKERYAMERQEFVELKHQMGGRDRRQFEALLTEWKR